MSSAAIILVGMVIFTALFLESSTMPAESAASNISGSFANAVEKARAFAGDIISGVTTTTDKTVAAVKNATGKVARNVKTAVDNVGEHIKGVAENVHKTVKNVQDKAVKDMKKVTDIAAQFASDSAARFAVGALKNLLDGVKKAIDEVSGTATGDANDALTQIKEWLDSFEDLVDSVHNNQPKITSDDSYSAISNEIVTEI